MFCGPFILVECILTVVYYKRILNDCSKIPDAFTNILIYILIIMGCISLTVTAFCFYMSFVFGKTVKESWPQIRNPSLQRNQNNSEDSIERLSQILRERGIDIEDLGEDEEEEVE